LKTFFERNVNYREKTPIEKTRFFLRKNTFNLNPEPYLILIRAGEPERLEPHDLVGAGAGAGAILFFLQEPEHFKNLEWSRSWSRSWHKLVRLQAPAVFKNFVKN